MVYTNYVYSNNNQGRVYLICKLHHAFCLDFPVMLESCSIMSQTRSSLTPILFIPPANEVEGVYWYHSVRLSVCFIFIGYFFPILQGFFSMFGL